MVTAAVPVAVLGVGRMGLPISRRLRESGPVTVFDVDPARRSLAADAGLTVAASAAAAVTSARLVLTVLPGSPEIEALMDADGALLAALQPGFTWIDMTSTAPGLARTLAAAAAGRGVATLDARWAGGRSQPHPGT